MKGLLYWSTWVSENTIGQIIVSWMDGTHKNIFVDTCVDNNKCTSIQWPSSLTIDYNEQKLYWCDPRMQTIERIGLDGKNHEIIVSSGKNQNFSPFSVANHNQFIYFTDISDGNITRVNLKDKNNRE